MEEPQPAVPHSSCPLIQVEVLKNYQVVAVGCYAWSDAVVMVKIRKGSSCIPLKTLKTVFHGIFRPA